jgi:ribosomal-protein-alanine N-acetyltransferase
MLKHYTEKISRYKRQLFRRPVAREEFSTACNTPADTETDVSGRKNIPKKSGKSGQETDLLQDKNGREVRIHYVTSVDGFPHKIDIKRLMVFLHERLKPYEVTSEDIEQGIREALTATGREGGFVLIAELKGRIAGALVMQKTGMKGYIPENTLLFVAVSPEERGNGMRRKIVEYALDKAEGSVKLHVEYDTRPAGSMEGSDLSANTQR